MPRLLMTLLILAVCTVAAACTGTDRTAESPEDDLPPAQEEPKGQRLPNGDLILDLDDAERALQDAWEPWEVGELRRLDERSNPYEVGYAAIVAADHYDWELMDYYFAGVALAGMMPDTADYETRLNELGNCYQAHDLQLIDQQKRIMSDVHPTHAGEPLYFVIVGGIVSDTCTDRLIVYRGLQVGVAWQEDAGGYQVVLYDLSNAEASVHTLSEYQTPDGRLLPPGSAGDAAGDDATAAGDDTGDRPQEGTLTVEDLLQ